MYAYLDNSATTKPCSESVQAVNFMMTENFGNPSSLHQIGLNAHREINSAREIIAKSVGAADKSEIIFTSGGTEANNLAIFGAAMANKRKGNRIVTTAIEHESVMTACDELEKQGFEIVRLQPDKYGNITEKQIADAINSDTILVSIMLVNNEVGSIMPINSIKRAVKNANSPALIHVDAVQGYGKIPIKVQRLGVDLLTVTAHKIHGPKGSGALYIRKGVLLYPRIFGGEQERKIRSGTECAPLIAGFGAAAKNIKINNENIKKLNAYTRQKLSEINEITINSDNNASEYIINFSVGGIRSQTLIQFLSSLDIYVSNGSACAKGKKSHVLTAMNLDNDVIDSAVRVSFSRYNTTDDIEKLVDGIKTAQKSLSRR